jgi:hypothetical protein
VPIIAGTKPSLHRTNAVSTTAIHEATSRCSKGWAALITNKLAVADKVLNKLLCQLCLCEWNHMASLGNHNQREVASLSEVASNLLFLAKHI